MTSPDRVTFIRIRLGLGGRELLHLEAVAHLAPYFGFLLERTPIAQPDEPRTWRKDEYPD